jgi:hypothetical protein
MHAVHQRGELRGGEPHHTIADRRPAERTPLSLNLTYSTNEPFVLELKVLQARADQAANDAEIRTAFAKQSRLSAAAAVAALLSACLQVIALFV